MKKLFKLRIYAWACTILLMAGLCSSINVHGWGRVTKGEDHNSAEKSAKSSHESKSETGEDTIKIPIELVVLDVAVHDRNQQAVNGLTKDNFSIFEDKVQQRIEYFSQEVVPVSVGFVIDTSGSMRLKLPAVLQAAKAMVRLSRPGDEFFVVAFKDKAVLVEEFTSRLGEVEESLAELDASQGTALLDAIFVASDYAHKEAKNRRKALVVISDGDERDSLYKPNQLLDQLREQDVQVYMIGFPDGLNDIKGVFSTSVREKAVKLLTEIAGESGGRAFFPINLFDVQSLTEEIGRDVHSQYTIGYYSSNEKRDGSWRKVQIKLAGDKDVKKHTVRTRSGYFAGNTQASNQK